MSNNTNINLFELAARQKFRFESQRGALTVEDLFDVPLLATGRNEGFDLDSIARKINVELKGVSEESFVNVKPNPRKAELEQKLDLVKHVIGVKQAEVERAKSASERTAKRQKILEALNEQENRELSQASREDLLKKLAEVDEAG